MGCIFHAWLRGSACCSRFSCGVLASVGLEGTCARLAELLMDSGLGDCPSSPLRSCYRSSACPQRAEHQFHLLPECATSGLSVSSPIQPQLALRGLHRPSTLEMNWKGDEWVGAEMSADGEPGIEASRFPQVAISSHSNTQGRTDIAALPGCVQVECKQVCVQLRRLEAPGVWEEQSRQGKYFFLPQVASQVLRPLSSQTKGVSWSVMMPQLCGADDVITLGIMSLESQLRCRHVLKGIFQDGGGVGADFVGLVPCHAWRALRLATRKCLSWKRLSVTLRGHCPSAV